MPAVRLAIAAIVSHLARRRPGAEVGVTDGPKGVVVNTRNGKAYAAFPDLGVVKIVNGATGQRGRAQDRRQRQGSDDRSARWPCLCDEPRAGNDLGDRPRHRCHRRHAEGRPGQPDGVESRHQQAVRLGEHRHRSLGDRSCDEDVHGHSRRHRGQCALGERQGQQDLLRRLRGQLPDRRRWRHQPADANRAAWLPSVGFGLQRDERPALPADAERRCGHGRRYADAMSCPRSAPATCPWPRP